LHML
jgi:hypothetical protein